MFFALTIKDGVISGVHESMAEIDLDTFGNNPVFQGHLVQPVTDRKEYEAGHRLEEYTEQGLLKPLLWRIQQGFSDIPPGHELIDDELVPVNSSVDDLPESLVTMLDSLKASVDNIQSSLQKRLALYETMQAWSEIPVGQMVKVDQLVVSAFIKYVCLKEHKKGLLIPAMDKANWQEIKEGAT